MALSTDDPHDAPPGACSVSLYSGLYALESSFELFLLVLRVFAVLFLDLTCGHHGSPSEGEGREPPGTLIVNVVGSTNESRPRADPGPASGRVSPRGVSTPATSGRGQGAVHASPFAPARPRAYVPNRGNSSDGV